MRQKKSVLLQHNLVYWRSAKVLKGIKPPCFDEKSSFLQKKQKYLAFRKLFSGK